MSHTAYLGCACAGYQTSTTSVSASTSAASTRAVSTSRTSTSAVTTATVSSTRAATTAAVSTSRASTSAVTTATVSTTRASTSSTASASAASVSATSAATTSNAATAVASTTLATATTSGALPITLSLGTSFTVATTGASPLPTSPSPTSLCVGAPPLPTAECLNGVWTVPSVDSTAPVVIDSPIIVIGNATFGGEVTIVYDPSRGTPLSVGGCVILLQNSSLNINASTPDVIPASVTAINASCVAGSFATVRTNYRTCKGRDVGTEQHSGDGRGLQVVLRNDACDGGLAPYVVGIIVAVAVVLTVALIVALVALFRAHPEWLHKADHEDVHILLHDDDAKLRVQNSPLHQPNPLSGRSEL